MQPAVLAAVEWRGVTPTIEITAIQFDELVGVFYDVAGSIRPG
jgi:hypothetical protein